MGKYVSSRVFLTIQVLLNESQHLYQNIEATVLTV